MSPELWECVIDAVEILPGEWRGYESILSCTLVCREWTPRSQFCLFRCVLLGSAKTASKFMNTISTVPALGRFVQTFFLRPSPKEKESNGWICKVFQVLPPLLTNLYELRLEGLPTLHPVFHALSSRFTTVKSLSIQYPDTQEQSFREVIQIINGFKNLEKLDIFAAQNTQDLCYWKQLNNLKSLKVDYLGTRSTQDVYSWLLESKACSPNSLKKLSLSLLPNDSLETIVLKYSQSLQSIQINILSIELIDESEYKQQLYLGSIQESNSVYRLFSFL